MSITKVPFNDYLAIDALSASDLVNISRTPRDYLKGKMPRKRTENMLLGSLLHCMVLEPTIFESTYLVEPTHLPNGEMIRKPAVDGSMRKTKEGKAHLEEILSGLNGRILIPKSVRDEADEMVSAINENKEALALLKNAHCEQIVLWDKQSVKCKGQVDAYKDKTLIDLKTTSKIEPALFEADSYRRRYHQKMAWYKEGLEANGIEIRDVFLISVSASECIVRHMTDDLLERGRQFNEQAFEVFNKCKKENFWPSWPEKLSLGIPGFALIDFFE